MKIIIDDEAVGYIFKKGGNIKILFQSCYSAGG